MITLIKSYLSVLIGALLLGTAVVLWAMPASREAPAVDRPGMKVVLASVLETLDRRTVRFSGITKARHQAKLSFSVPARVKARPVEEGTHIQAGQVLAKLDDSEFRHAEALDRALVNELQVRLDQAMRDRHRVAQLAAHNVATKEKLEQITAQVASLDASLQAAQARLEEAQRRLKETILKAPYSGTVTALHIEPGEWAAPGQPVIDLAGDGPVELKVEVPESIVTRLEVNQPVTVVLPFSDNRRVPGRIRSVAMAAMTAGQLFPVKIALASEHGVRAGLTAQIWFELIADRVLTVPLASVINPGSSQPCVFVFRNGKVHRQPVELGRLIHTGVIVRGALSAGERVVVTGQSQLSHGDSVEVKS